MINTAHNITAITDSAPDTAGAIVYVNYRGAMHRGKLAEAWEAEGLDLDLIPEHNSFRKALTMATQAVARAHGLIKLKKPGGWEVVEAADDAEAGDSAGTVECLVTLSAVNTPQVSPEGHPFAEEITSAYFRALYQMDTTDTSQFVGELLRSLHAVTLRDRGGVYFLAAEKLPMWRRMVRCIEGASSHRPMEIPAMQGEEAAEAVLDALIRDTGKLVSEVDDLLADDDTTARVLRNRARKLTEMVDKMTTFDGILGDKLGTLRSKLSDAEVSTVEAIFRIESEED